MLPDTEDTVKPNVSTAMGKVAIVGAQTTLQGSCPGGANIVDFVGYGPNATCNEGNTNTPSPSLTTSVSRLQSGCADVDVNGADFTAGAPNPRNSASPPLVCPCIVRNESDAALEA